MYLLLACLFIRKIHDNNTHTVIVCADSLLCAFVTDIRHLWCTLQLITSRVDFINNSAFNHIK